MDIKEEAHCNSHLTEVSTMTIKKLQASELYRSCDIKQFDFKTTAELDMLSEAIGQERAVEAVRFGIGIQRDGYNLYALGPKGIGKYSLVHRYIEEKARAENAPSDWCYVNNFREPHKPNALELPSGTGNELSADMEQLIDDLHAAIPAVFESVKELSIAEKPSLSFQMPSLLPHMLSKLSASASPPSTNSFAMTK